MNFWLTWIGQLLALSQTEQFWASSLSEMGPEEKFSGARNSGRPAIFEFPKPASGPVPRKTRGFVLMNCLISRPRGPLSGHPAFCSSASLGCWCCCCCCCCVGGGGGGTRWWYQVVVPGGGDVDVVIMLWLWLWLLLLCMHDHCTPFSIFCAVFFLVVAVVVVSFYLVVFLICLEFLFICIAVFLLIL